MEEKEKAADSEVPEESTPGSTASNNDTEKLPSVQEDTEAGT